MAFPQRRAPQPVKGFVGNNGVKGVEYYSHQIVVGAAGAISSQDTTSGITATKQATAGQYLLQFPCGYRKIICIWPMFFTAPGANTVGQSMYVLTDNLTTGSKNGQVVVQFTNASAGANADLANPSTVSFEIEVAGGV